MAITETRIPTADELPLPPAYESERANWRYYAIDWDNVTSNPTELTHSFAGSVVPYFRQNTVTGETDFIPEGGRILAMRPVLKPYTIAGFATHCEDLKATVSDSSAIYGVQTQTRLAFSQGTNPYPFYEFANEAKFNLNRSGGSGVIGSDLARVVRGPDFDESRDFIQFGAGGQSGSFSEIELYGERHNTTTAPQNYQSDIATSMPGFGSPPSDPYRANGNLQLKDDLRFSTLRAFPIEVSNPQRLYLTYSWQHGAFSVPPENLGSTSYLAPNFDPALGNIQQYQPNVVGVCVLFEGASLAQQSAFWHPNHALYSARNATGAVEVASRTTATATPEILATLSDLKNPSIFQMKGGQSAKRGKDVTGAMGLLARHTSGQWRFYRSEDSGKNWSFMSAPFESNDIDYMFPVATQSGVVVAAVLKGTPNKLVVKRGSIEQVWQADSAAVVVRPDVPNLPVTIVTPPDGRSNFSILFNNQWLLSPDGGNTWP